MIKLFKKITPNQKTGKKGEKLAKEYLKKQGYEILECNFRSRRNEIDIIATYCGDLIFVEVKTTASDKAQEFKLPSEAVDKRKIKCLTACAIDYIQLKKRSYENYRFDVIEVYLNKKGHKINHIQSAFYVRERTK